MAASSVSYRTVFRMISNDESRLSFEVASGVNKLIPEITVGFLLKYDVEYQIEKNRFAKEAGVKSINEVITAYKLDKLYPEFKRDKTKLYMIGKKVFGLDNIANGFAVDLSQLVCNFSKAENSDERTSLIWVKTAYEECKSNGKPSIFKSSSFSELYSQVKDFSKVETVQSTLFNMKYICDECGINFYYRPSIANSKVKAVAVKDKEGYVYIFASDLFKCVENLWLSFVHELTHIKNNDFEKIAKIKQENLDENENYINSEVIKYYVGNMITTIVSCDVETVMNVSKHTGVSSNIVAEITRFLTSTYNVGDVNKMIHYYKSEEIQFDYPLGII